MQKNKRGGHRLVIDLSVKQMLDLEQTMETTSAATYAEVVRNALRVYAFVIGTQDDGGTVHLTRGDGPEAKSTPVMFR